MPELTNEQRAAVGRGGRCIVSASAGSGKTFVMIQKICNYVEDGGDLENILAITYTTKAAAEMKEKLRDGLVKRIRDQADPQKRAHVKAQLNKIAYADVSTVHSFCSRLIRTYFYIADVDASFDIAGSDDSAAQAIMAGAADELFEELYESGDEGFMRLLERYRKKRSDAALKKLMLGGYAEARNLPDYRQKLFDAGKLFCEDGFNRICREIHDIAVNTLNLLIDAVNNFEAGFVITNPKTRDRYAEIFAEMRAILNAAIDEDDIFEPLPPLYSGSKPRDGDADKAEGERFSKFKDGILKRYKGIYGELEDRQTEYERFMESGRTAVAFCELLLKFDDKFFAAKKEEGKLDYSDLEHCALKVLQSPEVIRALRERYKRVYVDEFQDVNPVQEKIINSVCGGEAFFVGDKKQAIYGFRGSRSSFFDKKIQDLRGGDGSALELTKNFRSCEKVIDFVNALFTQAMNKNVCGFNYAQTGEMRYGGGYPSADENGLPYGGGEGYGNAEIDLFTTDAAEEIKPNKVYSVRENSGGNMPHSPLGLAVLRVVESELYKTGGDTDAREKRKIYDLKKGWRDIRQGDICILTRKRSNEDALEIARTLRDAGYSVTGAKEDNICQNPEVKQLIDILSYLDNAEQDIPLCASMLSGIGGFCEDELARIRIAFKGEKGLAFRDCALKYAQTIGDEMAKKLNAFFARCESLRCYADVTGAGALIDKLCEDAGWEAEYSAGNGEKLKNIRRVQSLAYSGGGDCSLSAFLKKLKDSGYSVSAPESADSDSIKIMTMHSSKGLEFPVVIIADICTSFKGAAFAEMPFDDDYGFAPRWFNGGERLCGGTVLRKVCKLRSDREEIKNELNLFYVACTRAMCSLHVMAGEISEYKPEDALFARNYSQLADFTPFKTVNINCSRDIPKQTRLKPVIGKENAQILQALRAQFARPYDYAQSLDLDVKSSASKVVKLRLGEDGYAVKELFAEDETPAATGAERGVAYHRFLQLCDFSKKSPAEVDAQLNEFCADGRITDVQRELLDAGNLTKILNMSVFEGLAGLKIYREREFLCRLKACEFLPTSSEDAVLVQGAIDLLAMGGGGAKIIDYKYSVKSDEALVKTYAPQLELYKKAVSAITGIPAENISTAIVNICRLSEIRL